MTPWTVARQAPLSMGLLQARIREWVAMPSSRGSSGPRDRICVSCTAGRFFTAEPPGKPPCPLDVKVTQSCPTLCDPMSESLRPHGLYSPWNSPGQDTGVGRLSLLQGIFPTQGSNPGLPQCGRILYHLSHKGRLHVRLGKNKTFGISKIRPILQICSLPTSLGLSLSLSL